MKLVYASKAAERITDAIAVAGIASWLTPEFRDVLASFSELAALLVPILSVIWLTVQIVPKVSAFFKK